MESRNDPSSPFVVVGPALRWSALPAQYRPAQTATLQRYRRWYELFSKAHAGCSADLRKQVEEIDDAVVSAIELQSGWHVKETVRANQVAVSELIAECYALLPQSNNPSTTLVPDTNALLKTSNPADFRTACEVNQFTFVLCPTVLSELDELKVSRRDQSLAERAEKAISRIKGFRSQGSLHDGVTVDGTIKVKMVPTEPRMAELPKWLDPYSNDDRLIGSCLELQFQNPTANVILVTGDINLQNKAEMAFLPFCEPPRISLPTKQANPSTKGLSLEDRAEAVDVEVEITQGMSQTFIFNIRNCSDEQISVGKVTFGEEGFKIAEWEADKAKPTIIGPRASVSVSWNPLSDPVQRLRALRSSYDRALVTTLEAKIQLNVLGQLRFLKQKILVQLDQGAHRIWQH